MKSNVLRRFNQCSFFLIFLQPLHTPRLHYITYYWLTKKCYCTYLYWIQSFRPFLYWPPTAEVDQNTYSKLVLESSNNKLDRKVSIINERLPCQHMVLLSNLLKIHQYSFHELHLLSNERIPRRMHCSKGKSDGTMQLQLINTVGMKYCEAVWAVSL